MGSGGLGNTDFGSTAGFGGLGTRASASVGSGISYGQGRVPGSGPNAIVRTALPSVTGLLSPEAIRRVVLRNLGQVRNCHEQGLQQTPTAQGQIVVRFIIGGDGHVLGANVVESSYPIASVGQCVADAARRWMFPSPEGGGIVTVRYPFNLQRQ
jgi:TonB family protein